MKKPVVWPPSGVLDVDMYVHHNEGKTLRTPNVENTTPEEDQYPDAVWP